MASSENINDYCPLEELSTSDFEIVDGQPDIQGWDIEDSAGVKVGEVDELLFDPETRKVRYIVLDTENNDLELEDGHVLIPIGVAELHENNDTVLIPGVTVAQITSLPLYERGRAIDKQMEKEIRDVFMKPGNSAPALTGFYEHDHFSETKFYGKRSPVKITAKNRLLTEGEREVPRENSTETQKYNRDNIIP